MGKFLDEKAIVNRNIESFVNYLNDTGRYIEGNETSVTYYHKNNKASYEDVGLGNVVEIIGSESPIKYNRIENFPLYAMSELNLTYDYDEESSLDTPLDGSAVILANTIKPLENDYFSISYLNKNFLFKVYNIEGSHIGEKFYYKIEFTLSRDNIKLLEENQIAERFEFTKDNLGSKNSPLIISDLYSRLDKIKSFAYDLKKSYKKRFFDANLNMMVCDETFDDNLHYFLDLNTNLFIEDKTYMENIKIEPVLTTFDSKYVDRYYSHTIYLFFELIKDLDLKGVKELLTDEYIWFNDLNSIDISSKGTGFSRLSRSYRNFRSLEWFISKDDCENTKFIDTFYNSLLLEDYEKNFISDIVLYYLDTNLTIESRVDKILDTFKTNMKQLNSYTLEMYIFIPCILFLLEDIKNSILHQTNNFIYEKNGGNSNV